MRIKEYTEDFQALPNPVKYTIYLIAGLIVLLVIHQSVSNYAGNRKIEKLENENRELISNSRVLEQKAKSAEENAANEAASRLEIEKKLNTLEKGIKGQNEKIIIQSNKSNSLRTNLDRIRRAEITGADETEIRRKAANRYGQSGNR